MLFDLDAISTCTLEHAERYRPRISPPENDLMRYLQIIRGNTIGTNGKLTAAWAEIEQFLSQMDFHKLERYFDFLLKKLEVACLWVPRHVDPNAVYETINGRGKKLNELDLIRNYLYSHFNAAADSERRKSLHKNLERIRTVIPSSTRASEYMRCHLQCIFGFLRKDKFYHDAKVAIRTKWDKKKVPAESISDYVFGLTEQVTSHKPLELFRTMTAGSIDTVLCGAFEVASRTTNSRRNLAVFLRELGGYKVTQPLVFAMLMRYMRESDGFKKRRIAKTTNKNLSRLATFVLRTAFVATKFEPSHFEEDFSNYANTIAAADDIPDADFAHFLMDCDCSAYGVLDDARFRDAMVTTQMTGERRIKQFLLGIAGHVQKDARLLNERFCSIEHILPKSPEHRSSWSEFGDDGGDWVHRVGNLTLIGQTDNKPGPKYNGDFKKKRNTYRDSGLAITRELSDYADWTPARIEARQREMAKQAVRVWAFA